VTGARIGAYAWDNDVGKTDGAHAPILRGDRPNDRCERVPLMSGVPGSLVGVFIVDQIGKLCRASERTSRSATLRRGQFSQPMVTPRAGWHRHLSLSRCSSSDGPTVGLLLALVLVRRGHDTRTMLALGVGLGPLMAVVASDAIKRRDPNSPALLLEPGIHHGGQLDVLVLVQGEPADVQPIRANLEAVRARLGLLTVARAVAYEWTEGDLDNEVVTAGRRALADAADRLPVRGAELSLWPGPVDVVAERFRSRHIGGLVLVATAEPRVGRAVSG